MKQKLTKSEELLKGYSGRFRERIRAHGDICYNAGMMKVLNDLTVALATGNTDKERLENVVKLERRLDDELKETKEA